MDTARYAELFLTESREHLSAINHGLLDLERRARAREASAASTDADQEALRATVAALFRAVHTVKGMSATMGYTAVAALSHEMETLLDRVRQGQLTVQPALMDVLFTAADTLESSIERAVGGAPDDRSSDSVAARLRALAHPGGGAAGRVDSPGPAKGAKAAAERRESRRRLKGQASTGRRDGRAGGRRGNDAPPDAEGPIHTAPGFLVRVTFAADAPLRGVRAAMVLQKARELGQLTATAPAEDAILGEDFGHELALRLVTTAAPASVTSVLRAVGDVTSVTVTTEASPAKPSRRSGAPARPEADRPAASAVGSPRPDVRPGETDPGNGVATMDAHPGGGGRRRRSAGTSVSAPGEGGPANGVDGFHRTHHVRIDLRRLDALMNLIGELVIARGPLGPAHRGAGRSGALRDGRPRRLVSIGDLQDEIMTCRMVPVWQVFDRFPALVRDAARSLGKQVAFDVDGKEIELDRSMLDEIGDPIVHLLRNAVDHGIEAPDVRIAAGKPPEGRLTLSAARDRSAVSHPSDGRRSGHRPRSGACPGAGDGLVDAATTTLTDEEVIRLIARPGFTTAERVTDLSGRGVGIDAVQTRVRALGGSVDIKSVPGQGHDGHGAPPADAGHHARAAGDGWGTRRTPSPWHTSTRRWPPKGRRSPPCGGSRSWSCGGRPFPTSGCGPRFRRVQRPLPTGRKTGRSNMCWSWRRRPPGRRWPSTSSPGSRTSS